MLKLNKIGIKEKEKFICFASRSHHYRNDPATTRDSSIYTQLKAIRFLRDSHEFKAVRLGYNPKDKLEIERDIIDYSNTTYRNDFMDIFLLYKCDFIISTGLGINAPATMFRKPKLMVNFVDYFSIQQQCENYTPFILPKKFISLKNKKIIPLEEVYEKKLYEITEKKKLNTIGYDIKDNSDLEILDAVKEFYFFFEKKKHLFDNQKKQDKFWDLYERYFNYKPFKLKISNVFFEDFKIF